MKFERSYRYAFTAAFLCHLSLFVFLMVDSATQPSVLARESHQKSPRHPPVKPPNSSEQVIQARRVDQQAVMAAVNRIQQERLEKQKAEAHRQAELKKQAELARQRRIQEERHLAKIKQEASQLEKIRQQKIAEANKRLQALARKKEQEKKQLAEMKKQQQALQKKRDEQAAAQQAEQLAQAKRQETLEKAEQEQKRLAEIEQAARAAKRNERIAGEVDKYKALIIQAISREWILPDQVDSQLSSQFRIHLAPNGVVLEVNLMRSSGDPVLDRSAQSAIYKASPLPVPNDPDAFNQFRDIHLTVRPEQVRG